MPSRANITAAVMRVGFTGSWSAIRSPTSTAGMFASRDAKGKPLAIDGLWTLTLGGGRNSNSDTLYFTAGPNGETDGLFGTITPVSRE